MAEAPTVVDGDSMTLRPYAWKIRLGNTENFLDIDDLTDGYLLWRNGSKVMSTLIDQGKLSLSAPQNPNDAATKQYVDSNLEADESARVAADIHLQAQINALLGTSLTSGDKGDITISSDGYGWAIDSGTVTNAKLAAVASGTIKGRSSAGSGAVEDLTGSQATALLSVFATEAKGLVPAATGGGTTNFLRADGTWAAPPGDVAGPSSATDNAIARFDGTTGKIIQDGSGVTLSDAGAFSRAGTISISATGASSDINITAGDDLVMSGSDIGYLQAANTTIEGSATSRLIVSNQKVEATTTVINIDALDTGADISIKAANSITNTVGYKSLFKIVDITAGDISIFDYAGITNAVRTLGPNGSAGSPSYSFDGNSNTGIYRPAADSIALSTAGTEKIRVTSDGYVGIGTVSPGALLTVDGSGFSSIASYVAEFESSSGTADAGRVLFSQGSTYAMAIAPAGTSATTGRIDFQYIARSTGTVSSTLLSLRGDGKVGIGTTSPSKSLHISNSGLLIDGQNSVETSTLAGRLIVDAGASTGHTLADLRNNNGSTLFVGGSTVGIGTSSPATTSRLSIAASSNDSLASVSISNTYTSTGTWVMSVPGTGKTLSFTYNGNQRGYLSNSVNVSNIDFTGQHRSVGTGIDQLDGGGVGLIVVAAGDYQSLSGERSIGINEALPRVTLSSARNQKSVFGVISDKEDDDSPTREYWVGNFVNVYDKNPGDNRLIINSLGEGGIWVCNINGNLENGDFITSCEIPGYGMKQDDDLMHSYTVAKITCDCDFDLASTTYLCQEFEFNGATYRKAFVGCTYHCG